MPPATARSRRALLRRCLVLLPVSPGSARSRNHKIDHGWRTPKPGMLKQAAADFGFGSLAVLDDRRSAARHCGGSGSWDAGIDSLRVRTTEAGGCGSAFAGSVAQFYCESASTGCGDASLHGGRTIRLRRRRGGGFAEPDFAGVCSEYGGGSDDPVPIAGCGFKCGDGVHARSGAGTAMVSAAIDENMPR